MSVCLSVSKNSNLKIRDNKLDNLQDDVSRRLDVYDDEEGFLFFIRTCILLTQVKEHGALRRCIAMFSLYNI